jgi:hypothetical protein
VKKTVRVEYLECKTYSGASRSVARRRLVEQEDPSACATADFNWGVNERSSCIAIV